MSVELLTDAERSRLSGFPMEVPTADLHAFFTLNGHDRAVVLSTSAPANRLGFAVTLCAVRYLDFCPDDLSDCPKGVVGYVAKQLGLVPEALRGYRDRGQTRGEHLKRVHVHLGYRRPPSSDLRDLFGWLVQMALERDDPALLVRLAAERLKVKKFVRPGVSRLERMVATARGRTDEETHRALAPC